MAKTPKKQTLQEVQDSFDSLTLEDQISLFFHAQAVLKEKRESKQKDIEKLNQIEGGK